MKRVLIISMLVIIAAGAFGLVSLWPRLSIQHQLKDGSISAKQTLKNANILDSFLPDLIAQHQHMATLPRSSFLDGIADPELFSERIRLWNLICQIALFDQGNPKALQYIKMHMQSQKISPAELLNWQSLTNTLESTPPDSSEAQPAR